MKVSILAIVITVLAFGLITWFGVDSYYKFKAEETERKEIQSKLNDIKVENTILIDSINNSIGIIIKERLDFEEQLEDINKREPQKPYYDKNIDTIKSDSDVYDLWARHYRNNK